MKPPIEPLIIQLLPRHLKKTIKKIEPNLSIAYSVVSLSYWGRTNTLNHKNYLKPTIIVGLQNEWFAY